MSAQVSANHWTAGVSETTVREHHQKGIGLYKTVMRWSGGIKMMSCEPTLDLHYRVQPSMMQAYWGMCGADRSVERLAISPPNVAFEGRAPHGDEEVRLVTCRVEPKLLDEIAGTQIDWSSTHVALLTATFQNSYIERNMRRLLVELSRPKHDSNRVITALCELIAIDLARQFSQDLHDPHEGGQLSADSLQRIHDLVHTPIVRIPSMAEIARDFDISVPHLRRLFKQTTGKSLSQDIDDARIGLAFKLLQETSQPLKVIAFILGYSQPSSLTAWFQRTTGMLPSEFRQLTQIQGSVLGPATQIMPRT